MKETEKDNRDIQKESNMKIEVEIGMMYVYKPRNPQDFWQLSEARREAWDGSSSEPPERTNTLLLDL